MQNLKLFAFAVLGVSALAINTMTSTGCTAEASATGGASGSSDAGSGGTSAGAGGSTAGAGGSTAGAGGAAAGAGGAAAGAGGSAASVSASGLAEALKGGDACKTCLEGLKGTVKDGGGADVTCDGVLAKCDGDKTCQDYIASIKDAGTAASAKTDANCWVDAAGNALNGGNATTQDLTACTVVTCGEPCGKLSLVAPTGCE